MARFGKTFPIRAHLPIKLPSPPILPFLFDVPGGGPVSITSIAGILNPPKVFYNGEDEGLIYITRTNW